MNKINFVKQNFKFLTTKGFKCKTIEKNSEVEIYYTKDNICLLLYFDQNNELLGVQISNEIQSYNIADHPLNIKNKLFFASIEKMIFNMQVKEYSLYIHDNLEQLIHSI